MVDSGPTGIDARVTRYNVKRFRLGQALVPPAMLITIFARRTEGMVAMIAMAGVLGSAALAFLSAIKRFGWRAVRVERGSVWVGVSDERVRRESVRDWTWLNGVARLYGADANYTLKARSGGEAALESMLRGLFGQPRALQHRGTFRARMIALSVALLGLVSCVSAFMLDSIPLIVVGVPAFGIGLATFGALSQRVAHV
jgi:hypothetical protein